MHVLGIPESCAVEESGPQTEKRRAGRVLGYWRARTVSREGDLNGQRRKPYRTSYIEKYYKTKKSELRFSWISGS
jgi:hypothetical protein